MRKCRRTNEKMSKDECAIRICLSEAKKRNENLSEAKKREMRKCQSEKMSNEKSSVRK